MGGGGWGGGGVYTDYTLYVSPVSEEAGWGVSDLVFYAQWGGDSWSEIGNKIKTFLSFGRNMYCAVDGWPRLGQSLPWTVETNSGPVLHGPVRQARCCNSSLGQLGGQGSW